MAGESLLMADIALQRVEEVLCEVSWSTLRPNIDRPRSSHESSPSACACPQPRSLRLCVPIMAEENRLSYREDRQRLPTFEEVKKSSAVPRPLTDAIG